MIAEISPNTASHETAAIVNCSRVVVMAEPLSLAKLGRLNMGVLPASLVAAKQQHRG
jgi:hypothetical protein